MGNSAPIVAVDVMGSDLGPEELLYGIKAFLSEDKGDYGIVVVGNEEITVPMMMRLGILKDPRIKSYNAKEVITMEEKPIQALKQKKDAFQRHSIQRIILFKFKAVAERRQWSSAASKPGRKTRVKLWHLFWMAKVPSHQTCRAFRACRYSGPKKQRE